MTAPVSVSELLDRLEEARANVPKIRRDYPSGFWLEQQGSDILVVWSDGARTAWAECLEPADAACIVAEHNAVPVLVAEVRKHQAARQRAYDEGRWCGECEYGEVADPPCCLTYTVSALAEEEGR